jgi:chemotaxis protein CheZ
MPINRRSPRVQKTIFRIEQMMTERPAPGATNALTRRGAARPERSPARPSSLPAPDHDAASGVKRDIEMINRAIDSSKRELSALTGTNGEDSRLARARHELASAVAGMEKATQTILKAAETIDESARALHATLQNDYNRGLSQDIVDQIVRIYEACNFQDLSGQHIGKAIDTLKFVEGHVARMTEIWGNVRRSEPRTAPDHRPLGRALANGPKLDGDHGHVDQSDIDTMFSCA